MSNGPGITGYICKKINFNANLILYTEIISKWVMDLSIKPKGTKLLNKI